MLSFLDVDGILGYYHRTLQNNSDTVTDPLIQRVVS
jgi:hypothetical protein